MEHKGGKHNLKSSRDSASHSSGQSDNDHQPLVGHDEAIENRLRDTGKDTGNEGGASDFADFGMLLTLQVQARRNTGLGKDGADSDPLNDIAAVQLQILQSDGGEIVSKRYAKGRFYGKIEQKGTKGRKWDGIYFRDRQESVLDKQLGRCNR